MNYRIAVEPNLTPVKELLSSKGYQVESINLYKNSSAQQESFDAYIVNGLDSNSLGINETSTKAPVINAVGLTAEEVYNELRNRLM